MIFSVSELNEYVGALLSADPNLRDIRVSGEISGFKRHSSGHLYFSLKDPNAVVRCVMFRTYAQQLDFRPEDGLKVCIHGSAALYGKDGSFQLYVREMEASGAGDLYARFMALKAELEKEGLFDGDHKKPVPYLPECVGIVTSGTGAALQDILQIIGRRFPKMNISLCPVRVQGEGAALEIAAGIREMNRAGAADVLIVGRGGGSIEDLWAFNEPEVARAIYDSNIPVISAVGHETDFTIADFVADLRAPTPSAAAELAVPEYDGLRAVLDDDSNRLSGVLERDLNRRRDKLSILYRSPGFLQVQMRLADGRQTLENAADRMTRAVQDRLTRERNTLGQYMAGLKTLSPDAVLERGFSMVRDSKGNVVKSVAGLGEKDILSVRFRDGVAETEVVKITGG